MLYRAIIVHALGLLFLLDEKSLSLIIPRKTCWWLHLPGTIASCKERTESLVITISHSNVILYFADRWHTPAPTLVYTWILSLYFEISSVFSIPHSSLLSPPSPGHDLRPCRCFGTRKKRTVAREKEFIESRIGALTSSITRTVSFPGLKLPTRNTPIFVNMNCRFLYISHGLYAVGRVVEKIPQKYTAPVRIKLLSTTDFTSMVDVCERTRR